MSGSDDALLSQQLDVLERQDCYQVDEVLKKSPYEVTQRVRLIGADGVARQQSVRKLIKWESGLGVVYGRLFDAQREGRRFKHIPAISECFERDDELVVVMELVPGETLEEHVSRLGPSEALARDVFPRLCDAVIELHEEFDPPIIHRDLKPSNVILSNGGLTLIDFGIAREYRAGARADTVRLGTHSFAPPEQFGFGQTTVRSDVFALGMMLYFCLTGTVPDTYVSDADLAGGGVPPNMGAVIAHATSLDPANRFASARDLRRAFAEAAGSVPAAVEGPAQVSAPDALPSAAQGDDRFSVLGKAWNTVVIGALVVLLAACASSFSDPTPADAQNPIWVNVLDYLVLLPVFLLSTAWMLLDKRRLACRFPKLRAYKFRHWALICAIAFIVMFVGVGLTYSLTGLA